MLFFFFLINNSLLWNNGYTGMENKLKQQKNIYIYTYKTRNFCPFERYEMIVNR